MAKAVSRGLRAVTKDDAAEFEPSTLYVQTGGTIKLTFASGDEETITFPDNYDLPREVIKVWNTGTDLGVVVFRDICK